MKKQPSSQVVEVATLDKEFAEKFDKPFILHFEDGTYESFDTEDEACDAQLIYENNGEIKCQK